MYTLRAMEEIMPVVVMGIAVTVVAVGWLVAAGLVVVFLNMRVKRLEREHPGKVARPTEVAFLWYALSLMFYPAAFVAGIAFLLKPETARMGRICAILGLADITAIVLLTCAALLAISIFAPGYLP